MLSELLKGRDSRKIANNTRIRRTAEGCVIQLHATDIITEGPDGTLRVDTGGWKTVTTKARLNDYLPPGVWLSQDRSVWYWHQNGQRLAPFTDGDTVSPDGTPRPTAAPKAEAATRKLAARIMKYAKACAAAIPMEPPSGGDCWLCCMLDRGHEHVDHLESHLEEGYIVPSLVYSALKDAKAGDIVLAGAFGQGGGGWARDIARGYTQRAVARYMKRRMGIAR